MNLTLKRILLIVLAIVLAAEVGFLAVVSDRNGSAPAEPSVPSTETPTDATEVFATDFITQPSETVVPTETDVPTEPTEPTETEPKETHYTLSFAGDCTFGSISKNWNNSNHFVKTIGENYDYPFANVREFFENDDFTIINLEGPLTDSTSGAQSKTFAFRGPTAYTQIMTGSSVEAVTLANNHAEDYGKAGYQSTTKVLKEAGITYVEKNGTALYTTESGLKIGLYAGAFSFDTKDMKKDIAALRSNGAEIVICAFHWGNEGEYRPTADQQKIAKAAIDAGADIVYGHHPHVLQKIEEYKDGYIFYSLGNFSFGGAALPGDYDTALLQLDVIRDENGKVSMGELTIIPCSISSVGGKNNFQPTPLEKGKIYDRVLSKLNGSFTGPNLNVDYSKLDPTQPPATNPPATEAPSGGESGGTTNPPAGGGSGDSSGSGNTGSDTGSTGGNTGGDTGSGNTGSGSSGNESAGGGTSGGDSGNPPSPPAGGGGGDSSGGGNSGGGGSDEPEIL